jgi:transposase InsO family protein
MTRVRRPQSNGILERFHRTLLDEHFRVEGRRSAPSPRAFPKPTPKEVTEQAKSTKLKAA